MDEKPLHPPTWFPPETRYIVSVTTKYSGEIKRVLYFGSERSYCAYAWDAGSWSLERANQFIEKTKTIYENMRKSLDPHVGWFEMRIHEIVLDVTGSLR